MKYSIDHKDSFVSRNLFITILSLTKREKVNYEIKVRDNVTTLYIYNDNVAAVIYSLAIKAKLKENTYAKAIYAIDINNHYEFFLSKKLTRMMQKRYMMLIIDNNKNRRLDNLNFYDLFYLMVELYKD